MVRHRGTERGVEMRKFFAAPENVTESEITLYGSDVNHIEKVLRMKAGDKVMVSDGSRVNYLSAIKTMTDDRVELEILEKCPAKRELASAITLYQGLPKGDKMDLITQKAVELGASRIVPVKMQRAVVKLDDRKAEKKVSRWNKIAEGASKQSGRDVIPEVSLPLSMAEALRDAKTLDHVLFPYELAEDMAESAKVLRDIRPGERVGVFIGPEGGFSKEEAEEILEAGGKMMSLGKRILRTETAALAVLAILMFDMEKKEVE